MGRLPASPCQEYNAAMIGFFIKKWFFDLWDNLLVALAANIGLVLPLSGLLLLPGLFAEINPLISAAVWCSH